jgi:hypothetical protein
MIRYIIKQLNVLERKVYRLSLGPVHGNEKENQMMLTDKQIYGIVKKPTIIDTVSLHRLCWFRDVQRVEGNRIVLVWGCTENGRK